MRELQRRLCAGREVLLILFLSRGAHSTSSQRCADSDGGVAARARERSHGEARAVGG
jgi:hypothetical protein